MMTIIEKITNPTTIWSPATNSPKLFTTPPAAHMPGEAACVSTSRVVAMFKTSRASVVAKSTDGKTLNSSGVAHRSSSTR